MIWATTWTCEPAIAAGHIEAIVWTSVDNLLTEELDRINPYRKIIEVRKGTTVIVRVLCLLNGGNTTTVEFLSPRRLSVLRDEIIAELIMKTRQREAESGLTRRPVGFARRYDSAR
jgi:hypothetical protein